jgi:membrane protein YdbS with pleckstrin-like domain
MATPANMLDPKVKTAWRVQALVSLVVPALACLALVVVTALLDFPTWIATVSSAALVAVAIVTVLIAPPVRYRRWRWEVREEEVRLQEGLIVVSQTVIPMVRVQHVDTAQGPIMRALGLTDVHVWTAAGKHTIPALSNEHAADLRDRIAALARVTDDGGL